MTIAENRLGADGGGAVVVGVAFAVLAVGMQAGHRRLVLPALAAAALADTLAAVAQVPAVRHVLALEGTAGEWLPPGFGVIAQQGRGLDERLAAAFGHAYARLPVPMVLIGMDTPQVSRGMLEAAIRPLATGAADAAFGPAADCGFWLLGLRRPDPALPREARVETVASVCL